MDPQLTSVRLVLNPEKMVVAEAQRTYTYLSLFGYPTDLVVANRIVPSDVIDPYFAAWKDAQATQLRKVREGNQPLPVKIVPLFGTEAMGLEALRDMATAAFGAGDPTQRFSEGRIPTIELTSPHSYRISVPVPFATRGEIRVSHSGDELFVQVGGFRHRQILPRTLAGLNPSSARLDEESRVLTIRFEQAVAAVTSG